MELIYTCQYSSDHQISWIRFYECYHSCFCLHFNVLFHMDVKNIVLMKEYLLASIYLHMQQTLMEYKIICFSIIAFICMFDANVSVIWYQNMNALCNSFIFYLIPELLCSLFSQYHLYKVSKLVLCQTFLQKCNYILWYMLNHFVDRRLC